MARFGWFASVVLAVVLLESTGAAYDEVAPAWGALPKPRKCLPSPPPPTKKTKREKARANCQPSFSIQRCNATRRCSSYSKHTSRVHSRSDSCSPRHRPGFPHDFQHQLKRRRITASFPFFSPLPNINTNKDERFENNLCKNKLTCAHARPPPPPRPRAQATFRP